MRLFCNIKQNQVHYKNYMLEFLVHHNIEEISSDALCELA